MVDHPLTPDDRLAIQDLLAAYARGVDARDYERLAALFREDAVLASDRFELEGRDAVVRGFRILERYTATTHLVGLPSLEANAGGARGETTCLAHHLYEKDGEARIFVMAIRYRDRFSREADGWRFAERRLVVDWEEDRPFQPAPHRTR